MPLLGLLVVIGLAGISHGLGFSPWATVTAAFIAAFHIVPVWFSEFPASETLSAVLLVGMLLVLVTAVVNHSTTAAAVAGSFGFLLAIARANALLLAPIVVLAGIAAITLMKEEEAKTTIRFTLAFFAASIVGFFYNIRVSSPYFVDYQLNLFFPEFVPRAVERLNNPFLSIVVGAILGAIVWGLIIVARRIATRPVFARRLSASVAIGLLVGLALFIGLRAASGNYASPEGQVLILGLLLLGLAVAGVVVGALSLHSSTPQRQVVFWIALVTAVGFVALQAIRLDGPGNDVAPYYLYWHRYYISEVFPAVVILALWSIESLAGVARRLARADNWRRHAPAAVAIVVIVLIGFEALGPNVKVASGTMFKGSYEKIAELDRLTSEPPDAPIVYIGSNEIPPGWFWLNTARLIALPLADTFGRDVVGNQGPREPDLDPNNGQLLGILVARKVDTVYVIADSQAVPDAAVIAEGGWHMEEVGTVDVTIERLQWEPGISASDQDYVFTTLVLHVFKMTR
jgi:hypothetical protein